MMSYLPLRLLSFDTFNKGWFLERIMLAQET
jgi:hypothetical protein